MPDNDNHTYAAYDARVLEAELAALFHAYPELAEDDELRADTIEGNTDTHAVLGRLVSAAQDARHMGAAIAERIGDLQSRRQRFERRNEAFRALIFRLLKIAGLSRVALPEATLSVSKGRDSVLITDETRLPKWALRVVKSPDKTAIKERLDAGKKVPGAEMKVGEPTLAVRVA